MFDGFREQWIRGFLDLCLLGILARGSEYGRGLAAGLAEAGFGEIPGGTLYPALLRLEGRGFVRATRVPSTLGPVRKYYELTPLGAKEASRRRGERQSFRDAVERVVSEATADAGSEEPTR